MRKKIKNKKTAAVAHTSDEENKFRLLAENSSDIIFHFQFKPKPSYTYVSPSVKQILGYTPEQFYRDPMIGYKIIHPDDRKQLLNSQENIVKKKAIKKTFDTLAARYITKSGKTIWLENRYSPVYRGKEIIALQCICRDINEQKQKEEELNQRWLNYRNLIEALPSGIFVHVNGKIIFGNKEAYKIADLNRKENLDKLSLVDFLLPKDRPLGIKRIKRAMSGKDTPFVEYNIVTKKGTKKVIRTKSSPIVYNATKAVQIILQDITKEKKLQEERAKARNIEQVNKALKKEINMRLESEQKLKAIFESSAHLVWTLKKDTEIISYNKKYAQAVKELCGTTLKPGVKATQFKWAFNEADYNTLRKAHKEAFSGRATKIEIPLNAINGNTHYREMHFYPITIDGKIKEIAAVAQDTTERRNYEKQIVEQSAKLKTIFESGSQRIWTINRKREITSFNKNFENGFYKAFGKKPKLGSLALDIVAGTTNHKFWKDKYTEAFNGKSIEFETDQLTKEGRKVHAQVFFHPIYNEKGLVVEIAAISQDITERKNAEQKIMEQAARLNTIFNSGNQIMWTVNRKGTLTSFNKNYSKAIYEMYDAYPELNTPVARERRNNLAHQEYKKVWDGRYEEVFKSKKSIEFNTERTTPAGKKIYRQIFLHPIFNERKEVTEVSGIGYDITAQHVAREQIINKQSQLSSIINTTGDIIFSVDRQCNFVEFNNVIKNIIKKRHGVDIYSGLSIFHVLPELYHKEVMYNYQKTFSGQSVLATEIFYMDGVKRIYEAHYKPIIINGNITGAAVFSKDITEQERAKQDIITKQFQLTAIINTTNDIILSLDKNYNVVEFNNVMKEIAALRVGREMKAGDYFFDYLPKEIHAEMKKTYKRALGGENVQATETFLHPKTKDIRIYSANYNPINVNGEIVGIAIFSRDITEQKKSEEETLRSLKEKDVLLKEIHHRVKNNLQVISSILNLQTAYLKDRPTINILKECQNRIKTMAFIHESLYQNKDFSQINFSEYIVTLVKNLFYSFEASQQKIRSNFDVEPILLNLDTSIPCGLIVNELVSNALKYAFNETEEGVVFIELKKTGGKIKMVVADNGKGFPDEINYKNTETLGLQLVNTLTEQINGTISMKQNKGTIFEIIF